MVQHQALLIPEPANRYDPNAVRVVIRGQHVGYLTREDAPLYQPMIARLLAHGYQPTAPARIWARQEQQFSGTDRRGRDIYETRVMASVTLGLDEPHLCVPANLAPASAHALLPFGSAIQVKGGEEHQEILLRYLHPQGEQWAHAVLRSVEKQTARTSRQIVEVLLDGDVVGELTPAMSAEFLPVIERLRDVGRLCVARVIIKGNQVKADVVLHATKAVALDQDWLATHFKGGPLPITNLGQAAASAATSGGAGQSSVVANEGDGLRVAIPPRPTRIVFRVPGNWPQPPDGWEPPPGWQPPPEWPLPPADWQFWTVT